MESGSIESTPEKHLPVSAWCLESLRADGQLERTRLPWSSRPMRLKAGMNSRVASSSYSQTRQW
jgi:hypothetical protein